MPLLRSEDAPCRARILVKKENKKLLTCYTEDAELLQHSHKSDEIFFLLCREFEFEHQIEKLDGVLQC
jgi:hypothetical protein